MATLPLRGRASGLRLASMAAAALVAALALLVEHGRLPPPPGGADRVADDTAVIAHAFAERRSGIVVEAAGIVAKTLPDDREGSRHQRLIVRLADGATVLLSHNIDLADRIAGVRAGDELRFRGQYEWNDRGGVVHWTHRDPAGKRPGGWIEHEGRVYR